MSLEREAMKGRLTGLKDDRRRLRMKAEGLCDGVRQNVNIALRDVEEIDIAQASCQMDELVATLGELAGLQGQIVRLERELK